MIHDWEKPNDRFRARSGPIRYGDWIVLENQRPGYPLLRQHYAESKSIIRRSMSFLLNLTTSQKDSMARFKILRPATLEHLQDGGGFCGHVCCWLGLLRYCCIPFRKVDPDPSIEDLHTPCCHSPSNHTSCIQWALWFCARIPAMVIVAFALWILFIVLLETLEEFRWFQDLLGWIVYSLLWIFNLLPEAFYQTLYKFLDRLLHALGQLLVWIADLFGIQ